jgi:hypothetical protein
VWITVKATELEVALEAGPKEELGSGLLMPLLNGVEPRPLPRNAGSGILR